MAELIDILDAFTMPLKIGWVVWLAWGIGLAFWHRHEGTSQPSSPRLRTAPVRKPFVSKPSIPPRARTRLITPEPLIAREPARLAPPSFEPPSFEPPPFEAPPFDPPLVEPAPALLEETNRVAELDRFVADFEMNTRHRRSGPVNGESSPFDGHTQNSSN